MTTLAASLDLSARPSAKGIRLPVWVAVFVVLNLLDLFLTWCLIGGSDAHCYEANPLASSILETAGWLGLAAYKAACVAIVLAVGIVLAGRRPAAARRVFAVGCAIVTCVVGYSVLLLGHSRLEREQLGWELERLAAQDRTYRDMQRYHEKLEVTAAELAHGRRALPDAVRVMKDFLAPLRYDPFPSLRILYLDIQHDEAVMAAHVIRMAGFIRLGSRGQSLAALERLSAEFGSVYAYRLPAFSSETFAPPGDSRAATRPAREKRRAG